MDPSSKPNESDIKPSLLTRFRHTIKTIKADKKSGKKLFWAWIIYQAIKGVLTTSLIWIPLLYAWLHR